jgi:RND family efflux transporter MFP subunit
MTTGKKAIALTLIGLSLSLVRTGGGMQEPQAAEQTSANPALSVTAIQPLMREIPLTISANGSIAAWQEAIIGAEVNDLRLAEVRVQVGESVRKGQILAVFADEAVSADIAQSRAMLAEAEANLADARQNAERAQQIADSGAISSQQVNQYLTSGKTALAKVQSAKAQLDAQLLRLKYTRVSAVDDGVISARNATLGAVAAKGQELFRMIRQNRLEWRAELTAAELARLKPGLKVKVSVPNVGDVNGAIRVLAPSLDIQSRNGLVYVDLPAATNQGFRAGMYAHGEFQIGVSSALTVPQTALSLREGFSYVFSLSEIGGGLAKVNQIKVQLGRRTGELYEILSGLRPQDILVADGSTFLTDGDSVRVIKP